MGINWPDLTLPPINLLSIGRMMINTSKQYYDDYFRHDTHEVQFADGATLYVDLLNENYTEGVIFVQELSCNTGNITRDQFVLALRQLATLIEKEVV